MPNPDVTFAGKKLYEKSAASFTISQLAHEFDVTPRTLRHYEEEGLISPRRKGQRRIYSRRDRGRLRLTLQGKRVGFSLAEIREMLDLYDLKDGQETQMAFSLERFRERIVGLQNQRKEIDATIAELEQNCRKIEGMLASAAANKSATPEHDPEKELP